MAEEKRRINLHGTVKEKSHYKDYKTYPNSWWFRLASWGLLLGMVLLATLIDAKRHMGRAMDGFFNIIGVPGMILICLLLSYALYRQTRKRLK